MEAELLTRPSSPFLDDRLGQANPVLDHGFVRVIDYMGNDDAIVQAARVSYGSGTKTPSDDRGLIRYLMRQWHTTPFEMCEIKLHVKLPVFVARQWIRHRTANVNEYSARYSILDGEFYIPAPERMAVQATNNKQGSGDVLPYDQALEVQKLLLDDAMSAYGHYERMVGDPDKLYCNDEGDFVPGYGLARELARMNVPPNVYTQWYWKVDLHNLFHFLRLRADPHAQWEIRTYADLICQLVAGWVPHAYEAFDDYRLHAVQLSAMEMRAIKRWIAATWPENPEFGGTPADMLEGCSKREIEEFAAKFAQVDV